MMVRVKKKYCICFAVFFCNALIFHLSTAQTIYTVAGTGFGTYSGDGGPSTAAGLHFPYGITVDQHGNIYFAELSNYCVRKVAPTGIITTFAGKDTLGFSGDGGPATNAKFYTPFDVAVDRAGNVYISDEFNFRIRKVDTFGIVTTFAGNGINANSGDGNPATNASVVAGSIAVDTSGNVYIGAGSAVRKVNTAGIISTVAGNGTGIFGGDGGPATAAGLDCFWGIDVDAQGNIYIAERGDEKIRKIDTSGIINTIAGNGTPGFSGDGGPATIAQMGNDGVEGVRVDCIGNLYITDRYNKRVRMVNTLGIITTFAGNGSVGYSGDGGPATAAEFGFLGHVARYGSGNVYIADRNGEAIRMVTDTNHAVHFTGGHLLQFKLCSIPTMSVDTILSAADIDTGQVERWDVFYGPFHGTLVANYVTYSTGSVMIPTGLSYTANPGFVGFDTFKVLVTDGYTSDTTSIYVRVDTTMPVAGLITGKDSVCLGDTIMLMDTSSEGVWAWSAVNGNVAVGSISGVATGASLGLDTVVYILNNACGADTTTFPLSVKHCPSSVNPVSPPGTKINIYPNPAAGAFTFSLPEPYDEAVKIIITNPLGEKVQQLSAMTNSPTEIQLIGPPGIYFINAVTAHGVWCEKVMINK